MTAGVLTPSAAGKLIKTVRRLEQQLRNLRQAQPGRFRASRRKIYLCKTDAAHDKGASGTVSIYAGTTKGSESDTGNNLTGVYNRFADLAADKWVHVEWLNGGWELSAAEC